MFRYLLKYDFNQLNRKNWETISLKEAIRQLYVFIIQDYLAIGTWNKIIGQNQIGFQFTHLVMVVLNYEMEYVCCFFLNPVTLFTDANFKLNNLLKHGADVVI